VYLAMIRGSSHGMRNEIYSSNAMAPIHCSLHLGFCNDVPFHKYEEAYKAGSQILPTYCNLVVYPVGFGSRRKAAAHSGCV
jgi:hypothetical protein